MPFLPQQRQETLTIPGDNDPVIPLANATGGCAVTAILPQGAELKALPNRGAWPIHGDRTLVEPPFGAPAMMIVRPVADIQNRLFWARRHWSGF